MNLGRMRVLLIIVVTVLVLSATRTAHAGVVPFGWPEGWSDLGEAGTVTRFAPHLRTVFCEESQILHVAWLADHAGGDSNAVLHRGIDLQEGAFLGPARIVYQMQRPGRMGDVDFQLSGDTAHLIWTERTEGSTELLAGSFTLDGGAWKPDWIESVFGTPSSIVDPRISRVGDRLYVAWSDSREGALNIILGEMPPDGPVGDGPYIHTSDTASVTPLVFTHAGRIYAAWVERVGGVARQLHVTDLHGDRSRNWIISYAANRTWEIAPSLHAHEDKVDLIIVNRDAGRDRLAHVDLSAVLESPPGEKHDVADIGTYLVSGSIAGVEPMRGVLAADELVFVYSVVDPGNRLSVSMGVLRGEDEVWVQRMTPTVSGASRPVIYRDGRGHRHLLFMTVQPDMSFTIEYMNTVRPADVSYWNVIGLDVKAPLPSLPLRFTAVTALALATLLPNVVPIIIGAVLVFAAGSFGGSESYWIPGLILGAFTLLWTRLLPEPFIYFAAPSAQQGDVIAAVVLCFVMVSVLVRWKGSWRGEPLSVIAFDFLWFLWFFMFTSIRV